MEGSNGQSIGERLGMAGHLAIAVASAGICVAIALLDDRPSRVSTEGWRGQLEVGLLGVVIVSAALLMLRPWRKVAAMALAVFWAVLLVQALAGVARDPADLSEYVATAEAMVVLLAIAPLVSGRTLMPSLSTALILMCAVMLLLFGTVHLTAADVIAQLIPPAVPFRPIVPFLTGGLQIVAAIALLQSRWRLAAARTAAALFATYLPVVHLPRLATSPDELFEWRFALTAVALLGALLVASGVSGHAFDQRPRRSGGNEHGYDADT